MVSKRIIGVAGAVSIAVTIFASPVAATDWLRAMERHEAAAKAAIVEEAAKGEWGFTLSTVMNDMEWRKRTAATLRAQRQSTFTPPTSDYRQLVEEPEPRRLSPF